MLTDHAVTRLSSEPVYMKPIVDRQRPVKTLPSLAVGKNNNNIHSHLAIISTTNNYQPIL